MRIDARSLATLRIASSCASERSCHLSIRASGRLTTLPVIARSIFPSVYEIVAGGRGNVLRRDDFLGDQRPPGARSAEALGQTNRQRKCLKAPQTSQISNDPGGSEKTSKPQLRHG